MSKHAQLIEAAIKFDESALAGSDDAGAKHFAGVLRLDPRHLSDNSDPPGQVANEIDVDFTSLLFMLAESIRQIIVGREAVARSILDELHYPEGIERVLVLLVQAWLPLGTTSLAEIDQYIQNVDFDSDLKSRVYMKLMTWEMEARGRGPHATAYYDRAVENASEGLRQSLHSVGELFGRDTFLYFPGTSNPLDTYSWLVDSVSNATADEFIRMAKKHISPFGRTFGGDPRAVPAPIRAAELQAGWAGAYWVIRKVRRVKASILLVNSRVPEERADAISSWILSGGSNVKQLISENESILNPGLVSKILVDDLKRGAVVDAENWEEICLSLWDQLPGEISENLIETLNIPEWIEADYVPPGENKSVELFVLLGMIEPPKWLKRYKSLQPAQRLTVALSLSPHQATDLPDSIKGEVRGILQTYCEQRGDTLLYPEIIETLAALVSELPDGAREKDNLRDIIPTNYSAQIGVRYPHLASRDRIYENLESLVSRIHEQLNLNKRGQWTTFGTALAYQVAACMVALNTLDQDALNTIMDFATAPASSANDVIDAVNALSWLADEGLLPSLGKVESRLPYRVDISPVDRMWSGRDDIRAINTVIAGLHARLSTTRRDAIALLVAATRDPDAQIRRLAVDQFNGGNLVVSGLETSVDAAILGAIYDPDYRVQASAIRAIRSISDLLVAEIAWARLISVWEAAHRRVRMTAAGVAAGRRYTDASIESLRDDVLRLASTDRSALVRQAIMRATGGAT